MKSSGTHSWVSLGSWKALTGIWLMRFRLSLRTWSVEPRWSRAPSSNTLILLLLRYLNTNKAHSDIRDLQQPSEVFMNGPHFCRFTYVTYMLYFVFSFPFMLSFKHCSFGSDVLDTNDRDTLTISVFFYFLSSNLNCFKSIIPYMS